ncbi:MAG: quinone-dependent dihydroorotate dehydrogenase [Bacteroidota bacterium]|jgi:dihydroorotate dehydrogenase
MYKLFLRPILFKLNPEKAHYFTFDLLKLFVGNAFGRFITKLFFERKNLTLQKKLFGLNFPNPIGLAAGLDKNATHFNELSCLGFGFIEIGTLTPKPQSGNDQPRLFRLTKDSALINRMGFNNFGVDDAARRLRERKTNVVIGGNIGKNKSTSNENAFNDYEYCFHALYEVVDYFVVNVSSPNTPHLRDLQEKEPLTHLLKNLQTINDSKPKRKPILLKIAPDLTNSQLDDIIEIVAITKIDGIIATNTTTAREPLTYSVEFLDKIGMGGLSGKPLSKRSTEVIRYLKTTSKNAFPIIGVGGIHSVNDAIEKLEAGADLLQLYTGFVYEGPALIRKINNAIIKRNEAH